MDVRFNRTDLIGRIEKIASVKERIHLSNLDGIAFINKLNKSKMDTFIYLDPPYYQKGADLYMNFYSQSDHEKLSKQVHKMDNLWMVSYDNHDFILNLYPEQKKIINQLSQAASNRIGDEILIFSKDLILKDSLAKLNSASLLE